MDCPEPDEVWSCFRLFEGQVIKEVEAQLSWQKIEYDAQACSSEEKIQELRKHLDKVCEELAFGHTRQVLGETKALLLLMRGKSWGIQVPQLLHLGQPWVKNLFHMHTYHRGLSYEVEHMLGVFADWCARQIRDLHKSTNASCFAAVVDERNNPKPLRLVMRHMQECQVEAVRAFASTMKLTDSKVRCMQWRVLHMPGMCFFIQAACHCPDAQLDVQLTAAVPFE